MQTTIEHVFQQQPQTIIVLKGIDYRKHITTRPIDLFTMWQTPAFAVAMQLLNQERLILAMEEYLYLQEMIQHTNRPVIFLNDNRYLHYYPNQLSFSNEQMEALAEFYQTYQEVEVIADFSSYYAGAQIIEQQFYVMYPEVEGEIIDVYAPTQAALTITTNVSDLTVIATEEDYLQYLQKPTQQVFFPKSNLQSQTFMKRFCLLPHPPHHVLQLPEKVTEIDSVAYETILQQYWGYDQFRSLQVYDLDEIENKVVKHVSQVQIIDDLVAQTTACITKANYRDIFVTASTGAGKSVMFQIPAIHLAQKYNLLTLVISPLIGLMQDQVAGLENRHYPHVRTINSDITPLQKQHITEEIANGDCHILYLSPESLLARSDLSQLIGERQIGLVVIDEAHIVTTWGKQFRPSYWYLGDYLDKMKKQQQQKHQHGFVIATFTATAIYGGVENMYEETLESLNMIDPITYLGYVRRQDIAIKIETESQNQTSRTEYQMGKFEQLLTRANQACLAEQKMVIYFPTVVLLNQFHKFCQNQGLKTQLVRYHGQLDATEKQANYEMFRNNERLVMLATKAFGMGIDINDVEIVSHFAPTGNVCDYVQEIGRAARREDLQGEAYFNYKKNDFKHINRLHGMSVIKPYQLTQIMGKIADLSELKRGTTTKANGMLVDAENFEYIFETEYSAQEDLTAKVQTAMLLLEKDFKRKQGYSPFVMRPSSMFAQGYFALTPEQVKKLTAKYGNVLVKEVADCEKVPTYSVNLQQIWQHSAHKRHSFPQFKYFIYTSYTEEAQKELATELQGLVPASMVHLQLQAQAAEKFQKIIHAFKNIIDQSIRQGQFISAKQIEMQLTKALGINKYVAQKIVDNFLTVVENYQKQDKVMHGRLLETRYSEARNEKTYKFENKMRVFWNALNTEVKNIDFNKSDQMLAMSQIEAKKLTQVLGLLEVFQVLTFESKGGKNSQLYIYVNEPQKLKKYAENPYLYENTLLTAIDERHKISVAMLRHLFEGNFTNTQIWDMIEDYFLGVIPEAVLKTMSKNK